jgi:hypothetical protein
MLTHVTIINVVVVVVVVYDVFDDFLHQILDQPPLTEGQTGPIGLVR